MDNCVRKMPWPTLKPVILAKFLTGANTNPSLGVFAPRLGGLYSKV